MPYTDEEIRAAMLRIWEERPIGSGGWQFRDNEDAYTLARILLDYLEKVRAEAETKS